MEITKSTKIELTESDIKEIICDYLHTKGYNVNDKDIKFNIGHKYNGDCYGMYSNYTEVFEGCDIIIKGE